MNRLWMTLFLIGGMIQGTVGFLNESFCQDQMPVSENPETETVIISQKNSEISSASEKKPQLEEIAPEARPISGLLQFHQKKDQLFMELTSAHLNTDFIIIISIARGLGDSSLYGGMSWDFGEDMIWQFRKVNDRIQIVRRNFRYQAPPGTPESDAIQTAFTDSILYSLPIIASGPNGGDIIDLSSIFMSDLPMISSYALPGFSFARDRSTWKSIKGLKENMELEISATYAGSRTTQIETVMDARGISIDVHYSISRLPNTGYQPRLADERVGYFNTVLKDFSKNAEDNNFVRYINRWNLQKLEPNAQYSLPKKPIVFWLEKTIPYQYRKPIRDGILEWNKAFERAGFYNAIEVRQQEENDEWDPEDINYNTIRWSTAGIGFAIGPSRVNPMTGEILDADVVLDVGFINSWNRTFELYSPDDLAKQFCGEASLTNIMFDSNQSDSFYRRHNEGINERLYMSQQMGFAETFFDVMACEDPKPEDPKPEEPKPEEPKPEEPKPEEPKPEEPKPEEPKAEEPKAEEPKPEEPKPEEPKAEEPKAEEPKAEEPKAEEPKPEEPKPEEPKPEEPKAEEQPKAEEPKEPEVPKKNYDEERQKLIKQGLQFLATHEVGHTLGLRHNFKLSSLYTLDELNDPVKTAEYGYAGSIMEYLPVNIMPKGMPQGDYSPTKLGQYDYWVIEYGYKPFGKGTDGELEDLKKIAEQQTRPELNYATDEDCYGMSADPLVNVFDLGKSPLEYAKLRARLVKEILPGLNDRIIKEGESYNKMRARFAALLSWHGSGMTFAARYIGGIHVNRDFKGDPNSRPPFEIVAAQDQRDALAFLNEEVFGVDSYNIPANIYNYLAPNRWRHWGSNVSSRYDLDIHDSILSWQTAILWRLFSSATLSRLADYQLRVGPDQDVFTSAEMVESLTTAIFKELESLKEGKFSIQNQAIRSVRRNLQRVYYEMLADAALNSTSSTAGEADFYALARLQLSRIRTNIQAVLSGNAELDPYTKAHLSELETRITQTLDASITRSL